MSEPKPGSGSLDSDKPNLVLIDDDQMILSSVKLALRRQFNVICCQDALQGAIAGSREDVAVVIVDIKMPTYDGFWVIRKIRESNATVPIIINSAYQDARVEQEIEVLYRPYAYISKTCRFDIFIDTLLNAVAGKPPPAETAVGARKTAR